MSDLTDEDRAELRHLWRIGAGLEIVGRSVFQRLLLEDKILKFVDRREQLKNKSDPISCWMVAAIQEAILSMGPLLRASYPRIKHPYGGTNGPHVNGPPKPAPSPHTARSRHPKFPGQIDVRRGNSHEQKSWPRGKKHHD